MHMPLCMLMIYQQKCQWALCTFDDISTKQKTKPLCIFDDISTAVSSTYRLLVLVLIYHQKCKVALRFCWYIIKQATCSFTLLLIYQQTWNVAFAFLMMYQQTCQMALCICITIICGNNNTINSDLTHFSRCYPQIQCFTTISFVFGLHIWVATCLVGKTLRAIAVWRLITHMHTHKWRHVHTISCYVHTYKHTHPHT